ncbi:hypothetical protein [Chitinimonas sp. BJB300]|uniref:hypothetical protein n=1 Tax=Chitinimonas sp. BJB300 TaxID=1559339 RepID=UPI000C0EC096|nr:hypothetical protein [Chitinimonas sp. BJB300]PHV12031.1 hypothetical protein CSQ89_07775 [Chitinimonas sp. BJB300]
MALGARQYSLDLRSPADHYDLITPQQQRELVLYTPLSANRKWHVLNAETARERLAGYVEQPDIYVTPNEFFHWRRIKNGAAINALYVDIDAHDGRDVMYAATAALSAIDYARIPSPNAIIYTGRGVHLYWLINRTSANVLPRWQGCQRRLVEICKGDRMSADMTRVLRVIGTRNSRADHAKVKAELLSPARHDFDWLHDQIMPMTRSEIRDLRAARAARRLDDIAPAIQALPQQGSIYCRWFLVYQDLHKIIEANWQNKGIEPGHRDTMLFHLTNALSWFTRSASLQDEILHVAQQVTPTFTPEEVRSYCTSIFNRARDTSAKGIELRYKYYRSTLWTQLSPVIPSSLLPDLRAIIPDELATERRLASKRKDDERRRRAAGAVERSVYLANADKNRREALTLKAQGMSVRGIAATLNCSIGSVQHYLKTLN